MFINKFNLNIIFWILLFLLLYSNYTPSTFVFDNRAILCVFVMLVIFIRLIISKHKLVLLDFPSLILILSYLLLFILDMKKGLYASAVGSLMFVSIIVVISSYDYEKTFKQIVNFNHLLNLLSLYFFITAIIFFNKNTGRSIFGLSIPFFLSFTSQASLIPALLVFPLSIYTLFYVKYQRFFFILLTIVICFGGNVYVAIFIAVFLYFIIDKFSRLTFILLPFIFLLILTIIISHYGSYFFNKTIELRSIANKELLKGNTKLDWEIERKISGTERFAFYYDQISGFKHNFIFGSSSFKDFQSLGSVIFKFGLRGGIMALLLMSTFFGFLLNELYKYNKFFPEKKIGVVLIYSLIIQTIVYNEMGFYSLFSIALFFILVKLLMAKNSECQMNERSLMGV